MLSKRCYTTAFFPHDTSPDTLPAVLADRREKASQAVRASAKFQFEWSPDQCIYTRVSETISPYGDSGEDRFTTLWAVELLESVPV